MTRPYHHRTRRLMVTSLPRQWKKFCQRSSAAGKANLVVVEGLCDAVCSTAVCRRNAARPSRSSRRHRHVRAGPGFRASLGAMGQAWGDGSHGQRGQALACSLNAERCSRMNGASCLQLLAMRFDLSPRGCHWTNRTGFPFSRIAADTRREPHPPSPCTPCADVLKMKGHTEQRCVEQRDR